MGAGPPARAFQVGSWGAPTGRTRQLARFGYVENPGPPTGQSWVCRKFWVCRKRLSRHLQTPSGRATGGWPGIGGGRPRAGHQLVGLANWPNMGMSKNLGPSTGQIWVCRKSPSRRPSAPRPSRRTGGRSVRRNPPGPAGPSPQPSTGERPRRRDAGPVRPGRPPPPSKRPALPGPLMGRY
jgi:hypothetical protein